MALRFLGDLRLVTVTDDVESQYALTDAWASAPTFVLRQAPWRFATTQAALVAGGSPVTGYGASYAYPADWVRTHAIFLLNAQNRECPFDLREQSTISVNVATVPTIRYVSSHYADPSFANWPEHFAECVAAYLAFLVAERVTGERSASGRMSELFSSLLPQATAIDAMAEDPWLMHQRSGTFLRVARTMIDEGYWRFALVTAQITTAAGEGDGGLAYKYAIPSDWSRTRSIYQLGSEGRRCPIDVREAGNFWHTDATNFFAQYVSATIAMDSTQWPDHYMRAILRQIESDTALRHDQENSPPTYGRDYQLRADQAWQQALADTKDSEADAPDDWLRFQLDGRFREAVALALEKARWKFAINTVRLETDNDPGNATIALSGTVTTGDVLSLQVENAAIPNSPVTVSAMAVAGDTLMTLAARLAIAINAKPELAVSGIAASTDNVTVQWLSYFLNSGLTFGFPVNVPAVGDPVINIVLSRPLNPTVPQSVIATAVPGGGNISYTPSVSGAKSETLTLGVYAGATPSPGYTYRFPKPNDWVRTIRLYYSMVDGARPVWFDIDYRDEDDAFHTNFYPVVVRYLSQAGFDSTLWSSNFRDAVLAWLQHTEARADPKMAAVAAARFKFWEDQLAEAEEQDDTREVPQIRTGGRMIRGRYGRGTLGIEQAMPPFQPL